ncbi:MAG: TolB family protein, partial [Syntrophothermus sp.]
MKQFILTLLLLASCSLAYGQQKHAMTTDDLWAFKRLGDAVLSPDGKTLAYVVTSYDMDKNKGNADIWLADSDGKNARPLKNSEAGENEPRFLPDGEHIAYTVGDQIHVCRLDGSDDKELTSIYSGASGPVVSKDGKYMLFVSSVYPGCTTQDCNKDRDEAKKNSKVKAEIFTELMYRHWDNWRGEKRSHLFLLNTETKEFTDLTLNSSSDVPPIALGSANDYSFSPDGSEIAFTMNEDKMLAASTNNDIFIIKISDVKKDGKTPYTKISLSKGNDNQPVYSPDGKYIAYCSMERAGFEADRQRLMLYDRATGKTKDMTTGFDRSVGQIIWSPDSKTVYFDCAEEIYNSVYTMDIASGKIQMVLKEHVNEGLMISPDGKKLFVKQQRTDLPSEIFSLNTDGSDLKQLTNLNQDLLSKIEFGYLETVWFKGEG